MFYNLVSGLHLLASDTVYNDPADPRLIAQSHTPFCVRQNVQLHVSQHFTYLRRTKLKNCQQL